MFSSFELFKKGYTCPDLLSSCCMYDCSSLRCQSCIQKHCCCCCPGIFSNQTYPHIEYGRIQPQSEEEKFESEDLYTTQPEPVTPVPIQKIFQYPQSQRHFPLHPQIGSKRDESSLTSSIVRHQPYIGGHSKYSSSLSVSDISGSPVEKMKLALDFSQYGGTLDEIGADVGYVDTVRSSVYLESDIADSLHVRQQFQSGSVLGKVRSKSPSPLPCLQSLGNVGTEYRKQPLQIFRQHSPETPCVHLSLYYDENSQKLIVHLKQASRLPTSHPEESSNPFAEIYLLPKKIDVIKSHTERKTHNPVFDETFKFAELSSHEIRKQTVVMRMYNNERSHFIGGVLCPLESASMNGDLIKVPITEFDEEGSLLGFCCGDILLSLCYHSKAMTLEIVVIEINNLKKSDFIGMANPYVKVNMMQQDQRLLKWKTTVKKNTLMAVFYESSRFDVSAVDFKRIHFDVLIMDYDRVRRNSILGLVRLGYDVGHTSGEKQWQQALNNPNQMFSTWHCIRHTEKGKVRSPTHSRGKSPASCISVGYQI